MASFGLSKWDTHDFITCMICDTGVFEQWEVSQLPGTKVLGRTATILISFISSMHNWYILKIRKLPEFQSTFIVCQIHFMVRSRVLSFFNSNFKHLGVLGKQSTNRFSKYNKTSYAMLRNLLLLKQSVSKLFSFWLTNILSIKQRSRLQQALKGDSNVSIGTIYFSGGFNLGNMKGG